MINIQKNEYSFSVDVEKTQEYYRTHSICDCSCCRNYYAQIQNKFPKLDDLLNEFGVDISKPDEIMSVAADHYIDYLEVDYTVCGSIKSMGKNEIDIHDNMLLTIDFSDGFVSPNEQSEEYFTISVMQIKLPWVLDEPCPKPIPEPKRFWKRFNWKPFKK